jgi:WD40 repeat protein
MPTNTTPIVVLPSLTPNPTRTARPASSVTPTIQPTLSEPPADFAFDQLPGWIAYFELSYGHECGGMICMNLSIISPDFSEDISLSEPVYGMIKRISWSPDSRYIAYDLWALGESGGEQLWVFDFQNNQDSLLTPQYLEDGGMMTWSPDSRHLLVVNHHPEEQGELLEEWDVRSKTKRVLLDDPAYSDLWPAWSPSGESIVFSARKDGGQLQLWKMSADGTGVTRLSQDDQVADSLPAWKADGSAIAYYQENAQGDIELWTMDFDGLHPRLLLPLGKAAYLEAPVWSPDGRFLTAIFGSEEKNEVILFDFDTKNTLKVNRVVGKFSNLSWAPDSSAFIYFQDIDFKDGEGDDIWNLFVFNEGNPFAVDAPVAFLLWPTWSTMDFTPAGVD